MPCAAGSWRKQPRSSQSAESVPNPQVALASLDGARNAIPAFITADGPVREARFIRNPDGSLDGGFMACIPSPVEVTLTGAILPSQTLLSNLARIM